MVVVLTYVAGIAAERYVAATTTETDLGELVHGYGFRGLLIASSGGLRLRGRGRRRFDHRRALPAVIVAALIATIGLAGGELSTR